MTGGRSPAACPSPPGGRPFRTNHRCARVPELRFLLLGPVEAHLGDRRLELGRRRERALLAVLLLEAGHVVPTERLVDLLWDNAPPASARTAVHTHVSRLRTALDPDRDGRHGFRLHAHRRGYLAEADPDAIDAHRFTGLVRAARALGEPGARATALRTALALWRGPALQDSASSLLRHRLTAELTESRFDATELALAAELQCGRHRALIGELTTLTAEHPTRETFWAQLALALHRCGRQADALHTLDRARRHLVDDLGIDPGPQLSRLHQRILRADPALHLGAEPPHVPAAHHQLPADIADFTGRQDHLRRLHEVADGATSATATTICVIEGMGGAGKTRLAVRFAHQLVRRRLFDEIQLWAGLRGFHPEQPPADPAAVLENFLRLLGVAAHQIPADPDARAALYRGRLAGRRALVLLDDAASEDQIRPLLPGTADGLVVVTSRRTLPGLDGAGSLPVGGFTTAEALELLDRYAGSDRVRREADDARRLADLCGNLPLAVAVTARHLRSRPDWRLGELVRRLGTGERRLSELSPPARAARAVFDLSYRGLPAGHQRVFRLLAVHPGRDFEVGAVAALAGITEAHAQAVLDDLLDEHLLVPSSTRHRYGVHDLIRQYAGERSREHDPEPDRQAALDGLARHYLLRARHATLLIHPPETRRISAPEGPAPWRTAVEAVEWTETEYENLVATAQAVARAPDAVLALELVAALYRPLANRGHSTDRIALTRMAVRIARQAGDRHAEAQSLEDLGTLCGQIGAAVEAQACSRQAFEIWTELADPVGQQGCLADLGNTCRQQGDHEKAVDFLQRSLAIAVASGNRRGEASVLNFLGLTYQGTAEFATAIEHLARSAALFHETGNELGAAIALANRGWAHQRAGQPGEAVGYHRRGLEIFRAIGDRYNEAEQHWGIAQAAHDSGDPATARPHWRTAITILREIQAVDDEEATEMLAQDVPATPEVIRLNT